MDVHGNNDDNVRSYLKKLADFYSSSDIDIVTTDSRTFRNLVAFAYDRAIWNHPSDLGPRIVNDIYWRLSAQKAVLHALLGLNARGLVKLNGLRQPFRSGALFQREWMRVDQPKDEKPAKDLTFLSRLSHPDPCHGFLLRSLGDNTRYIYSIAVRESGKPAVDVYEALMEFSIYTDKLEHPPKCLKLDHYNEPLIWLAVMIARGCAIVNLDQILEHLEDDGHLGSLGTTKHLETSPELRQLRREPYAAVPDPEDLWPEQLEMFWALPNGFGMDFTREELWNHFDLDLEFIEDLWYKHCEGRLVEFEEVENSDCKESA